MSLRSCSKGVHYIVHCTLNSLPPSIESDHEAQMYQIKSLIDQLPPVNKETLKRIIGHLRRWVDIVAGHVISSCDWHHDQPWHGLSCDTMWHYDQVTWQRGRSWPGSWPVMWQLYPYIYRVTENESQNKMSISNIARLFGPTLMTVNDDPVSDTLQCTHTLKKDD